MNCAQMILMRLRPVRRPAYIRPVASLCCGGRKVHRRHHLGLMTEAFLGFMQLISVTPPIHPGKEISWVQLEVSPPGET